MFVSAGGEELPGVGVSAVPGAEDPVWLLPHSARSSSVSRGAQAARTTAANRQANRRTSGLRRGWERVEAGIIEAVFSW
jgi:hypothetical protein